MSTIEAALAGTKSGLGSLKIVMASGLYKTAAGIVGERLLKKHGEALQDYLTIALRSREAALEAYAGIEDELEHGSSKQLKQGPSERSSLYLNARNLVEYERLFGEVESRGMDRVPWELAPPGSSPDYARALDELRSGLGESERELVELHMVRGLNEREIAYILGAPKAEVEQRLDAAKGFIKFLLEGALEEGDYELEQLLKDTLRVKPPTAEQEARAKAAVVPLPNKTIIADRYEIIDHMGGGAFAYVYRARDVHVPGHVVALKLLHRVARTPAAREGAMRELSLIASAFHPSLVHFKDHGWYEDRLWFVMPWYEGMTLLDRIEQGAMEPAEAVTLFERLARALAALHAAGIRHQDIKPENIFLVELDTGAGEQKEVLPVILDLGVAAPNGDMALAGTPLYFPPEVANRIFEADGLAPISDKADVFALALSMLHCVEPPSPEEFVNLDVDAFLKKRAISSPSLPDNPKLAPLIPHFKRWLAFKPEERPTAGEFAEELTGLIRELGGFAGGGPRGRAAVSGAPRSLRLDKKALRALALPTALAALFLGAALLPGAPARPVRVSAAPAPAAATAAAGAHAAPDGDVAEEGGEAGEADAQAELAAAQQSGTEAVLLSHRLQVERRRAQELERELQRLRRLELGLGEGEADSAEGEEQAEAPSDEASPDAG